MDSKRKAPRWSRKLRFEADGAFGGEVSELSAVGMRLRVKATKAIETDGEVLAGTLTFETGANVRIKVRVARVKPDDDEHLELGLEITEADKGFFDALPKLRRDTGEMPVVK